MSQCTYCQRELPGFETLCQQCFVAGYERVQHPEPWWRQQLRPRFARGNFIGFSVLFAFGFAMLRFDFPYLHARHMRSTETSALLSTLFGCIAFLQGKDPTQSRVAPSRGVKRTIDWWRFSVLAVSEIAVGLVLYALFTVTPKAALVSFGVVSFLIVEIDILSPNRNRSIGSLLVLITAVLVALFGIVGNITDSDIWTRLTIVGCCLMATLVVLDRWQEL